MTISNDLEAALQFFGLPFQEIAREDIRIMVPYAHDGAPLGVSLALTGERLDEFKTAINRSINHLPEAPPWLFELADMLDSIHNQ